MIKRPFIIGVAILLLLVGGAFFFALARTSKPPVAHVGVTFAGMTNHPRFGRAALFEFRNESDFLVVALNCRWGTNSPGFGGEIVKPHETKVAMLFLTRGLELPERVEIGMRRQDTQWENTREGIASVLNAIGVNLRGLNPDSKPNYFTATVEVAKDDSKAGPPQDSSPSE